MRLLILLLLFPVHLLPAQDFTNPGLQSLVDAERAFNAMARERNTRDAFLHFLTDDAVTFAREKGPQRGKQHLEVQPADSSWLHWWPVFSDIAASGDFGYNTGPWQFRLKRSDREPVVVGQFVSLWKKNSEGEWRVALDIGVSLKKTVEGGALKTSVIKSDTAGADLSDFPGFEQRLIAELNQRGSYAYRSKLSPETRMLRPGLEALTGERQVRDFLKHAGEKITFAYSGGEIAPSGDLACAYGVASLESMRDGTSNISRHGYARFWKKEHGHWKIVLEVVSD